MRALVCLQRLASLDLEHLHQAAATTELFELRFFASCEITVSRFFGKFAHSPFVILCQY